MHNNLVVSISTVQLNNNVFFSQLVDYRIEFSKWWITEFKTVKFPAGGTVFDYYIETETKKCEPWTKRVTKFELDPEIPLQVTIINISFF